MTPLDAILLAASLFWIVLVLVSEARRVRGTSSAKLNGHMLFVRITLGIVFCILGVIGAFLPVLQGWLFFAIAALLIFPQSKFAIKALDKLERHAPRTVRWLHRLGVGVHRDTMRDPQ